METTPTPETPKKKSYGSILLVIFIAGIILWFGGTYVCKLSCTEAKIDSIVRVDTARVTFMPDADTIEEVKADSAVVDTTKKVIKK